MAKRFTYRFPASFEEIRKVEKAIFSDLVPFEYVKEDILNIQLALDEAITNAIVHGSHGDSSRTVLVDVTADLDGIEVHVEDEGDGFDYTQIPDPRADDRLHEPKGRGLFLIREFCDGVKFNDKGNAITITYSAGQRERDRERGFHRWHFNGIIVYEFTKHAPEFAASNMKTDVVGMLSKGKRQFLLDLGSAKGFLEVWCEDLEECVQMIKDENGLVCITGLDETYRSSNVARLQDFSITRLSSPLNAGLQTFCKKRNEN